MNKIKLFYSISVMMFFSKSLFAQFNCASSHYNEAAKKLYPEISDSELRFREMLMNLQAEGSFSRSNEDNITYTIPVVFHILHNYGPENISDAQVLDAVRIMDEDFQALNTDLSVVVPPFQPLIGNTRVRFRLAQKDPAGRCTNGIDRVATTRTYESDDDAKLNLWDPRRYLNIWTAASIGAEGVAGYSYYPSTVNNNPLSEKDGVIILHDYVGSIGTGDLTRSRALTHEVGHYLSLPHPWGGTNQPGVACGDDGVSDTPITQGFTSCVLYRYDCDTRTIPATANYNFANVTTSSGRTDPSPVPTTADTVLQYSSFVASTALSANSATDGEFNFSGWPTGANDGETEYTNMTGQLDNQKYYEFSIGKTLPFGMKITGITFTVRRSENGPRSFAVKSNLANNFNRRMRISIGSALSSVVTGQADTSVYIIHDSSKTINFSRFIIAGTGVFNAFNMIKNNEVARFRIYGWNAEDENGSFAIDNVALVGDYGLIENTQNYMDYSYCSFMYTHRQASQMRTALTSDIAQRVMLTMPETHDSTGIFINPPSVCAPKADFTVNRRDACVNDIITFTNQTYNTELSNCTYLWSFPGGEPSTSTLPNPTVKYATPGRKDVTLSVSNSTGSNSITKSGIVYVRVNGPEYLGQWSESFDNADIFYGAWNTVNMDNNESRFERVQLTDGSGNHCLKLNAFGNGKDKDILISPSFDCSFMTNPVLTFRYSGSTTTTLATTADLDQILDSVRISFSKDCGVRWPVNTTPQFTFSIPKTDIICGGTWANEYSANNNTGWKTVSIPIPSSVISNNVKFMIRFVAGGRNTNSFFLDDVNISASNVSIEEMEINEQWSLYPNPMYNTSEPLTLKSAVEVNNASYLIITDALGREISTQQINIVKGSNRIDTSILEKQANGVYYIRLINNNETISNFKLFKNL